MTSQKAYFSIQSCIVLLTPCLTSVEATRLIRDGEGGRGMVVGEERDYTPIATLSPPE